MPKYVDADKFIEDQRKFYCEDCYMRKSTSTGEIVYDIGSAACGSCRLNDVLNALEDTPTADVEEVRHGEWYMIEHLGLNVLKCSVCQTFINVNRWGKYYRKKFKYCPHCGAKMDGREDV